LADRASQGLVQLLLRELGPRLGLVVVEVVDEVARDGEGRHDTACVRFATRVVCDELRA
jgi:hypothetical protein